MPADDLMEAARGSSTSGPLTYRGGDVERGLAGRAGPETTMPAVRKAQRLVARNRNDRGTPRRSPTSPDRSASAATARASRGSGGTPANVSQSRRTCGEQERPQVEEIVKRTHSFPPSTFATLPPPAARSECERQVL